MLALAIDTTCDIASVTLAREEAIIATLAFRHKMDLLRRLMPNIDMLVRDAGVEKSSIDAVVVSIGPGSFTGIRIGVATAKSIAFALNKPIAGIPTLDVLAYGAPAASGLVVPMIHARPGEVYTSIYRKAPGGSIERLMEDKALVLDELFAEIGASGNDPIVFCGDGSARNRQELEARFPEAFFSSVWDNYPRGEVLVSLGIEKLLRGESDSPIDLVPNYVKRSTPEIRAEEAEKKQG
jgi:tRNA threonylcarbamoyladenosine biosynthesis protein TsaB